MSNFEHNHRSRSSQTTEQWFDSKFHGDFCGIGEGQLVVTLDRLSTGSEESAKSYAVIFRNDLFSSIDSQGSLIFLGASLEFQNPNIFPRIVGSYSPSFK